MTVGQRSLDETTEACRRRSRRRARHSPSYTYPNGSGSRRRLIGGRRVDAVRCVLTLPARARQGPRCDRADRMKLFASSTAIDTQSSSKLYDQDRRDDAEREKRAIQPSFTGVEGLAEGGTAENDEKRSNTSDSSTAYKSAVRSRSARCMRSTSRLLPISYVFKKGHRLRLELANSASHATDGVFSDIPIIRPRWAPTSHHDAGQRRDPVCRWWLAPGERRRASENAAPSIAANGGSGAGATDVAGAPRIAARRHIRPPRSP